MTDDAIDHQLEGITGNPGLPPRSSSAFSGSAGTPAAPSWPRWHTTYLPDEPMREVGKSEAYAQQFIAATARFQGWYAQLSPEKRENLNRAAREEFDDVES